MDGQRFSFFGGKGGPLWQKVTFKLAQPLATGAELMPGCVTVCDAAGGCHVLESHFLDYLEAQLEQKRCHRQTELPFDLLGGFVGYLGYELKAECGAPGPHVSPHPDAAMFFADRYSLPLKHNMSLHILRDGSLVNGNHFRRFIH